MKRIMLSVGVTVALFISGAMQMPLCSQMSLSIINPAYAIEGAGGNADDGGGDNGHINVVGAPRTRQPRSEAGFNDKRAAPLVPSTRDQVAGKQDLHTPRPVSSKSGKSESKSRLGTPFR